MQSQSTGQSSSSKSRHPFSCEGISSRRDFLSLLGVGGASVMLSQIPLIQAMAKAPSPPNVVLIFADDQGYGDLGCYGSKTLSTPNIDRLAAEGIKFTDFYSASSVCSPSRAALMTGCYPDRVGLAKAVLFPGDEKGLNPDEITMAELFKQRGYATTCIGKWHLGDQTKFLPTNQGFDSYFGIPYSNDMTKVKRGDPADLPLFRDEKIIEQPVDQSTLTRRYTQEAVKFIRKNQSRPFFLYLPHSMPHTPLAVSDKFRGSSKQGLYGDVIAELDWSTGQITDTLKELGIEDNTLVIYTSDNGPWLMEGEHGGSSGVLKGGKMDTWEGGLRVPCIMRWPAALPKGRICSEMATMMDLYPTVAQMIDVPVPQDRVIDGKPILPLMINPQSAKSPHEVFFYFGRFGDLQAVRWGKWKLHLKWDLLYNLEEDIGERIVVSQDHPEVVKKMRKMADDFLKELEQNKRPVGTI